MEFHVRPYREPLPNQSDVFVLTSNTWDDYGTVCLFTLSYVDKKGIHSEIGEVKILSCELLGEKPLRIKATTTLKKTFPSLGEKFISLGQSEAYYKRIHALLAKTVGEELLVALRDIAWNPKLAWPFEPTSPFRNALLRVNEAQQARRFGAQLALGLPVERSFNFRYSASIEGAEQPIEADIQLDSSDEIPGRTVCIVGRNAVGKTQFLANLARDLVQTRQVSSGRKLEMENRFAEGRRRGMYSVRRILARKTACDHH